MNCGNVNGSVENLGSVHFEDRPLSSRWSPTVGPSTLDLNLFLDLLLNQSPFLSHFRSDFVQNWIQKSDGNLLFFCNIAVKLSLSALFLSRLKSIKIY